MPAGQRETLWRGPSHSCRDESLIVKDSGFFIIEEVGGAAGLTLQCDDRGPVPRHGVLSRLAGPLVRNELVVEKDD